MSMSKNKSMAYSKALASVIVGIESDVDDSKFYELKPISELLAKSRPAKVPRKFEDHLLENLYGDDVCGILRDVVDKWEDYGFLNVGQRNWIVADLMRILFKYCSITLDHSLDLATDEETDDDDSWA